jgi:hypothetical protein
MINPGQATTVLKFQSITDKTEEFTVEFENQSLMIFKYLACWKLLLTEMFTSVKFKL